MTVARQCRPGYGARMKRMFTFGHGYSAAAFTRRLIARGWHVTGTTRSPDRLAEIRAEGATPLIWPGSAADDDAVARAVAASDAVLVSIAPGPAGDPVLARWADAIGAARPGWLGYLSTTNVYGDHGGGWVDEETPPSPRSDRGRNRLAAEQGWGRLAERYGLNLNIFRLAGIYGPGRGPFEKLRRGTARRIIKPGQVFSRIHVEDIAEVLIASLDRPAPGGVWNVCDDDPAPPQDVIAEAARILGIPLPPAEDFETAEMAPMARSFYGDSKRVANGRIKDRLSVRLNYPDYRSGLEALAQTLPDR